MVSALGCLHPTRFFNFMGLFMRIYGNYKAYNIRFVCSCLFYPCISEALSYWLRALKPCKVIVDLFGGWVGGIS